MTSSTTKPQVRRDLSAGAWTAGERIVSQFGQLTIFIVAARLLSPAEFGVFALVSACAILLLRFAEVGWAQYIMSWSGDDTVPRQVLKIAILAGLGAAILGGTSGLILFSFGVDSQTSQLVALFSLWILLAATSSAQKGILVWQHKLRSSVFCEISGEAAGLAVALTALFHGFGVLSLVYGRIAFQTVHLLLSFPITRLKPMGGMSAERMRDLKEYSLQLFATRMISNIRIYAATFIIGGFLGAAAVGYYRAAERLVGAVAEVVAVPSQVMAWSLFRQARDRHDGRLDGFQDQANSFFHVLSLAAIPVFIWVSVLAQDLIVGLLGAEWLPAAPLVAILALARALLIPAMATEPVLSLANEIKRLPKFSMIYLFVTVAVTLAAGPFGMIAVAWSQVIVAIYVGASMVLLMQTYGAIGWREVAYRSRYLIIPVVLATSLLIGLRSLPVLSDSGPLLRIFAVSIPTVLFYALLISLLDPTVRKMALNAIRKRELADSGDALL